MSKKVVVGICIGVIAIICVIIGIKLFSANTIIFKKGENNDYAYVIYEDKEYVPYCAISNNDRGEYLGHIENDKQEEIYTYKNYSKDEWLISFNKIGLGGESMLLKEKNLTNIPNGLSSEYEWNKNNEIEEKSNQEIITESKMKMEILLNSEKIEINDYDKVNVMYNKLSGLNYEITDDMSLTDGINIYFYDANNTMLSSYHIYKNYLKLNGVPDTYKITSTDFDYETFVKEIENLK